MAININMTKAIAIKQKEVRELRTPYFDALDVAFMRALENGDSAEQARLAGLKQQLRDATEDPAIVNATTPEELKAATPAILQGVLDV